MGVAVITSTWGGLALLVHSLARWATPKRCCSSTITMPRRANCTVSSMTAWVPTNICSEPSSRWSSTSCRFFPLTMPVSSSTLMSMPSRNSRMVARCCSARISVGAMMQAWNPLSNAMSMAMSATSVLPEPTSPCSNRFIWRPEQTSFLISRNTRFCASVSAKGR